MRLEELKGKKITVMGLGRLGGGVGVVRFLASKGADVLVTDLKEADELTDSLQKLKGFKGIEYVLGEHRIEDFLSTEIIVKNPAIPFSSSYLIKALARGIIIETDISLFLKLSPTASIGVTGTKGKTTTVTLIHRFLETRYPCFLGGVAGISPFDFFDKLSPHHLVVLELSSFELQGLAPHKISPHGAVITNIYPDHLNHHVSMEEYIQAKKTIFLFQKPKDFLVLNNDDPRLRLFAKEAPGKVYFFSAGDKKELTDLIPFDQIALKGNHNLQNILAAWKVAGLYHISPSHIRTVLKHFKWAPYRQEFIGELKGVGFYNDTTATIPEATIAAIKSVPGPLILIAGGVDKNLDYRELAKEIEKHVKLLVLLPGTASDKIMSNLRSHLQAKRHCEAMERECALRRACEDRVSKVKIWEAASMEEAVTKAFKEAQAGNNVLLSPGAASFNLFANEFERGEKFNQAVSALLNGNSKCKMQKSK